MGELGAVAAIASVVTSIVGAKHQSNMQKKSARTLAIAQEKAAKENVTVTSSGDDSERVDTNTQQMAEEHAQRRNRRRATINSTATNSSMLSGTRAQKDTLA